MSNEITIQLTSQLTNGELAPGPFTRSKQYNQTTKRLHARTMTIASGGQGVLLDLGNVTGFGYVSGENLDATNYVEFGPRDGAGTFWPLIRCLPLDVFCFRLGITTPYARANTASLDVWYQIFEQ